MTLQALPFFVSFAMAGTLLLGAWLGGGFTFLTPVLLFLILPFADRALGKDTGNTLEEGADGRVYDAIVRLWAPVQLVLLATVLSFVAGGELTGLELAGMVLSTALVTATGAINAAHELMHRKTALDRGLAEVLMTTAGYTHFCIEHVHGHHRYVATPLDPASSRKGEHVYAYLPRTVVGGLRSALRIERDRNRRRKVPAASPRNRLLRYPLMILGAAGLITAIWGPLGLGFFVAQAVGSFLLLEVINYVEHYGLQRAEIAPGRYERVQPKHSWNANDRLSNWWLFNLQRHADHHANASRPYYNLRAMEHSPQLPFSYPTMVLAALVPPLWFKLMDGRVPAQQPALAG